MIVNLVRAWLWTAKGAVAVWMMVEVMRVAMRRKPNTTAPMPS